MQALNNLPKQKTSAPARLAELCADPTWPKERYFLSQGKQTALISSPGLPRIAWFALEGEVFPERFPSRCVRSPSLGLISPGGEEEVAAGFARDVEGARLRHSAASLPAGGLLWCVQLRGAGYVTVVVPLAMTPVRNIPCLARSCSVAVSPRPLTLR